MICSNCCDVVYAILSSILCGIVCEYKSVPSVPSVLLQFLCLSSGFAVYNFYWQPTNDYVFVFKYCPIMSCFTDYVSYFVHKNFQHSEVFMKNSCPRIFKFPSTGGNRLCRFSKLAQPEVSLLSYERWMMKATDKGKRNGFVHFLNIFPDSLIPSRYWWILMLHLIRCQKT